MAGVHLGDSQHHLVLQTPLPEVSACGYVRSGPDKLSCLEAQHVAGPLSEPACELREFILIAAEEHRVVGCRPTRHFDLVERAEKNVSHAQELLRPCRDPCNASAKSIPVAVVDRRGCLI